MSAYIESKAHIDALVQAALLAARRDRSPSFRWGTWPDADTFESHELNDGNADAVGAMLWRENVRSVNARYAEENADAMAEVDNYRYEPLAMPLTLSEIIDAIGGYEYQSCEHRGWREASNLARAFCEALRKRTAQALADIARPRSEDGRTMWSVPEDRKRAQVLRRIV